MTRGTRFCTEVALAAVSGIFFLLTVLWEDWIEIMCRGGWGGLSCQFVVSPEEPWSGVMKQRHVHGATRWNPYLEEAAPRLVERTGATRSVTSTAGMSDLSG